MGVLEVMSGLKPLSKEEKHNLYRYKNKLSHLTLIKEERERLAEEEK